MPEFHSYFNCKLHKNTSCVTDIRSTPFAIEPASSLIGLLIKASKEMTIFFLTRIKKFEFFNPALVGLVLPQGMQGSGKTDNYDVKILF